MSWILVRHQGLVTEFLFDDFQEPPKGFWGSRENYPSSLPLQFDKQFRVLHRLYQEENEAPLWEYEIREYLK